MLDLSKENIGGLVNQLLGAHFSINYILWLILRQKTKLPVPQIKVTWLKDCPKTMWCV